jgi:hypothetical protein
MRTLWFLLVVTAPATGLAITPALPQQILCWSSYVVVGRVQKATSWECLPDKDRDCPNRIGILTIQILEISGAKNPDRNYSAWQKLRIGDVTDVKVEVWSRDIWEGGRTIRDPSANDTLTQRDLETLMLDRDFVFGISMARWDPQSAPYRSTIWRLERKHWVEQTLAGASTLPSGSCPRPEADGRVGMTSDSTVNLRPTTLDAIV